MCRFEDNVQEKDDVSHEGFTPSMWRKKIFPVSFDDTLAKWGFADVEKQINENSNTYLRESRVTPSIFTLSSVFIFHSLFTKEWKSFSFLLFKVNIERCWKICYSSR